MTEQEYQKQIEDRVYHINDYLKILKDVLDKCITETVHMSDEEIEYDRGKFIGMTEPVLERDKDGYYDYDSHTQTLSLEVEQLKRKGKILYSRLGDVDEQNKHNIDKDFFDERELDTDVYTKYKNH